MKIITPLIKYYDLLFESDQGDSIIKSFNEKEKILFKAVRNGSVSTDIQASKLLYDGNPSGQAYAKFKQVFYDKLIKISINLEIPESNEHLSKKFKLLREFHSMRLVANLSATQLSRNLQKKILLKAERLKMYDICAIVCHNLSSDYKILEKKDKEGTFYWEKYLRYRELESTRINAKNIYADVAKYTRKKHINEELAVKAKEKADELEKEIQPENVHAYRYYYQLLYMHHILLGKHHEVIKSNKKALAYFASYFKKYDANETLRLQIAISYFNLNMYEEAVRYLDESINPIGKKWLIHVSLRVRAFFSAGDFAQASHFISTIIRNTAFKEGRAIFQEQVWLFKYFADLMEGLQKGKPINTRQIKNNLTRIRVDKKGRNIPLLFADIINSLLKNGIDYVYNEKERLDIYYKSHVKPSKNKRAEIFMKFLLALPEYNYNRKGFIVKLEKIHETYKCNPIKDVVQPDNEVIRYEIVVSRILDHFCPSVQNNFRQLTGLKETQETMV